MNETFDAKKMVDSGASLNDLTDALFSRSSNTGEAARRAAMFEAQRLQAGQPMRRPEQFGVNEYGRAEPKVSDEKKIRVSPEEPDGYDGESDVEYEFGPKPTYQEPEKPKSRGANPEIGDVTYRRADYNRPEMAELQLRTMQQDAMVNAGLAELQREYGLSPQAMRDLETIREVAGPDKAAEILRTEVPAIRNELRMLDAQMEQVMAREINPLRIFNNGAGISASVAVAAGQLASNILGQGTPNVAHAIIESALARDLAAQEAEADDMRQAGQVRHQILQTLRGTLGDEQATMEYMNGLKKTIVEGELAKHEGKAKNAEAYQKFAEQARKIAEQRADHFAKSKGGAFEAKLKMRAAGSIERDANRLRQYIQSTSGTLGEGAMFVAGGGGQGSAQMQSGGGGARQGAPGRGAVSARQLKDSLGIVRSDLVSEGVAGQAAQQQMARNNEYGPPSAEHVSDVQTQLSRHEVASGIEDVKQRFSGIDEPMAKWVADFERNMLKQKSANGRKTPAIKVIDPQAAFAAFRGFDPTSDTLQSKTRQSEGKRVMDSFMKTHQTAAKFGQIRSKARKLKDFMRRDGDSWKLTSEGARKWMEVTGMTQEDALRTVQEIRLMAHNIVADPTGSEEESPFNIARGSNQDLALFMGQVAPAIAGDATATTKLDIEAWESMTDSALGNASDRMEDAGHRIGIQLPRIWDQSAAAKINAAKKKGKK